VSAPPGLTLLPHTVALDPDVPKVRVAGFLVRATASRRELGYIWPLHGGWAWRTSDGAHFGERQKQRAAAQALLDAALVAMRGPGVHVDRRLPDPAPAHAERIRTTMFPDPPPTPAPTPAPTPTKPTKPIQWAPSSFDLTGAVAALLKKKETK